MIWYDMIWYDMIWYDMIWYDMIWYDMIWYDMIWYMMWYIWCDMILYDKCYDIWYGMMLYDMIYMIRCMICYMIWYYMIRLLTEIVLSACGSSTVHIYTQTLHRTTKSSVSGNSVPTHTWLQTVTTCVCKPEAAKAVWAPDDERCAARNMLSR
jgi:hypothetical protein